MKRRQFLYIAAKVPVALSVFPWAGNLTGCSGDHGTTATTPSGVAPGNDLITKPGDVTAALFTTLSNDFFLGVRAGGQQCAKALGLNYEFFLNEDKPEVQLSQYETKAATGVNMITTFPPTETNTPAYSRMAKQFQLATCINHETPDWYFPYADGDHYVYYQIVDGIAAGYDIAKVLFNAMGGKGGLLHVSGWPGITSDRVRTAGMMKALSEFPDIQLLGVLPGKWNRLDGRQAMEDLMQTHPRFDGVFCENDDIALGVLSAIEEAGRPLIPIVGTDATPEFVSKIKEGKLLASCAIHPTWSGAYAVARAFDIVNGFVASVPERMMFYGYDIIDEHNVDRYIERYVVGLNNLPYDFQKMSRVLHPDDWDPGNKLSPFDPEELWRDQPQPSGFKMPEDWLRAQRSGEIEQVTKTYADQHKNEVLR